MTLLELIGFPFITLWYYFTAYVPRKLPTNPDEYQHFKKVLERYYGVPDEARAWILISGFVSSTAAHKLRRPWGHIANAAKRLHINDLAKASGDSYRQMLQERLKEAAERQVGYSQSVSAAIARSEDGRARVLSGDAQLIEDLAEELAGEHPSLATDEEWQAYIKSVALEDNVKDASHGNQNGKEQSLPNGSSMQAQATQTSN